ncbi:tungsten cofactor oxidoreductase radical SAM maturase [Alkaliphilus transvaalensis]|uniref:tungsten cofactor oxidoreductase radical SAM maturase n=1 Tax=Alkaliphilus transvaalensis TaxID=114628 RepID=UPI0006845DA8|nr:tungsten cofactor oxidoreductase radical SAM maturase [Alkaliphilus transvaalensis]
MKEYGYEVSYIKNKTIKKIYLELTDRCNLNCTICYRRSWDKAFQDMEDETLNKVLENIKNLEGLEEIVLGGIGEPTYYHNIEGVLEELKNYNLHVTTNGTLLKDSLINKLVETTSNITISVDGVEEYYQNIRGVPLNGVIEGIKKIQSLKKAKGKTQPNIYLQFVSSKENIESLFQVIDLGKELDCKGVVISSLIPQTIENKDKILYSINENKEMKELWHKVRNYGLRKGVSIYLPETHLKTERRCNFIDHITTYITAAGDIIPCYRLSHDYEEYVFGRKKQVKKYSFGNIKEDTLLDIWNCRAYQQFRYMVHNNLYPSCMDCDLVEGCEFPKTTEDDCYGCQPSCADCLWGRKLVVCP